jgi:predicted alpha/beta-fold hydrolase
MSFEPHPRLKNGHAMTIYAWARPRRFPRLGRPAERYFDVAHDARVLAHCHWQDDPRRAVTLLCLHGLEGSSSAHYMCGLADKAFAAGFNVVLLNQRNCGGTERLSAGLYHSGLTGDPRTVIEELRSTDGLPAIVVAGYSLGGNLALKLAGEYGQDAPRELLGVVGVSPIIDVAACVDALERRSNLLYEWNFVRNLKSRMRRKHRAWPGTFPIERLSSVRSVRSFDDVFTAPHFGFKDAADYYYRASAMRVIDQVRVPALIVAAKDDPFVPWQPFLDPRLSANRHITLELTEHGGHCAFVGRNGTRDAYWAERRVIEFASALREAASRTAAQSPAPRA